MLPLKLLLKNKEKLIKGGWDHDLGFKKFKKKVESMLPSQNAKTIVRLLYLGLSLLRQSKFMIF